MKKYTGKEIAIIGISGRFIETESISDLWNNLINKKELIKVTKVDETGFFEYNKRIKDKTKFDPLFFGYTHSEASDMDPQIRILHEEVWKGLEDAGVLTSDITKKIGLYVSGSDNFNWRVFQTYKSLLSNHSDFVKDMLSDVNFSGTLISYKLNLNGPVMFTSTACSSSLTSIHLACRSLLMRECNVAISASVCATSSKTQGHKFEEGSILSNDGYCRAFDQKASGTINGEGAGVVILKRLDDAIRDKDNIYSIIKGSAINNDGDRKIGYIAPSISGQVDCIKSALSFSEVLPESISYIETHGTGTVLGDSVEFKALCEAYQEIKNPCVLGAIKTSIGHLDAAAGIAGLMKVTMALYKKQIPPTLHFITPNSDLKMEKTPFYLTSELKEWEQTENSRFAAISSFGVGGSNAHIILEEFINSAKQEYSKDDELLILSAKSESSLKGNALKLNEFLSTMEDNVCYGDIAYTLSNARHEFPIRTFKIGGKNIINEYQEFKTVYEGNKGIVFMFSGQGMQYINMAKDLFNFSEYFRNELTSGLKILDNLFGHERSMEILFSENSINEINETKYTQPILFVLEYSLAKWMINLGVTPDNLIGHSIGEYVAATLSGVFNFEDALSLVVKRAELISNLPKGGMLAVSCSVDFLYTLEGPKIDIAAINDDANIVLSGTLSDIDYWSEILNNNNVVNIRLNVSHAFHSIMMEPVLNKYRDLLSQVIFFNPSIPVISCLTGNIANPKELMSVDYWIDHLRHTVKYSDGIKTLMKLNPQIFIEIGPGRFLGNIVKKISKRYNQPVEIIQIINDRKSIKSERYTYLFGLGKLWQSGVDIKWKEIYKTSNHKKISLPTYQFDEYHFLSEFEPSELMNNHEVGQLSQIFSPSNNFDINDLKLLDRPVLNNKYFEPITEEEKTIAEMWSELFGINKIGIKDDFFDLGGDSIKALMFSNKVSVTFNVDFKTQFVYENPSIEKLAHALNIIKEFSNFNNDDSKKTNEILI